jgi:uncharacterized RDD family membrane protein YckC
VPSTETLKIDTPEQVALEMPIAGIGSRFLALAIDTLAQILLYAVGVALILIAALFNVFANADFGSPWFVGGAVLLIFCVYWGYFATFEILWRGQTPGKRTAGIRVIRESGRPLDPTAAILRNIMRAIDFLPSLYGVGVVCMLVNRQSRRVGDFVAGTVVVHDTPATSLEPHWRATPGPHVAQPQAARLSDAEIVLIETYLQRRFQLALRVQDRTASQIAERVTASTGLTPEPGQTLDTFLESVARQAREMGRLRTIR